MKFIDIKRPAVRNSPRSSQHTNIQRNSSKNNSGVLFIFVIIFLAVILYLSYNNSHNTDYQKESNEDNSIDNLISQSPESEEPDPNPSDTPLSAPSGVSESKKSAISVTVLNGAGKPGLAQEIKNILVAHDFKVENIDNASNLYAKTTIYCSETDISFAEEIKAILSTYPSVIDTNSDLSEPNHITVVAGEETL